MIEKSAFFTRSELLHRSLILSSGSLIFGILGYNFYLDRLRSRSLESHYKPPETSFSYNLPLPGEWFKTVGPSTLNQIFPDILKVELQSDFYLFVKPQDDQLASASIEVAIWSFPQPLSDVQYQSLFLQFYQRSLNPDHQCHLTWGEDEKINGCLPTFKIESSCKEGTKEQVILFTQSQQPLPLRWHLIFRAGPNALDLGVEQSFNNAWRKIQVNC